MEEKVTVELVRAHEHEGVFLQPGAQISVHPDTANSLIQQDIAKRPAPTRRASSVSNDVPKS